MGLSANARAGVWLDGVTVAGQDLRLQLAGALLTGAAPSGSTGLAARPGVRAAAGSPLSVHAASGMNITVNAGVAFVQGSTALNSGMYTAVLDTTATLTVATSDPTNPRIDNVIVQITDVGTSSSTTVVTLQTGTPAPSPVAPALPANSLLLATVAVAANTSTIVAGNITEGRVFTAALGGIVFMDTTSGLAGPPGEYAHDSSTGRLRVSDGFGNARQPKIAVFAPVTNTVTSASAPLAGFTDILHVNVTVDGVTELQVYCSYSSLTPPAGVASGDNVQFAIYLDGAGGLGPSASLQTRVDSTSTNNTDGGNLTAWVTPAAGTHTIALMATSNGHAFTVNQPFIRVAPSLQQ